MAYRILRPGGSVWSGCLVAGLAEGEPLVAEVGDDFQAAAEGFDVGGQGPQFGRAGLGAPRKSAAATLRCCQGGPLPSRPVHEYAHVA
jgi:hypothetical protein